MKWTCGGSGMCKKASTNTINNIENLKNNKKIKMASEKNPINKIEN